MDNTTLEPTGKYPANPNGSPLGIAGISSNDGRYVTRDTCVAQAASTNGRERVLAIMPHPERSTLFASWIPDGKKEEWGGVLPWQRLFYSARRWISM